MEKRSIYWLKAHSKYLSDPDYIELPDNAKGCYWGLYFLALESDKKGELKKNGCPMGFKQIALLLHKNERYMKDVMKILYDSNFLSYADDTWKIDRFQEEQGKETQEEKEERERQRNNDYQRKARNKSQDDEPSEPTEEAQDDYNEQSIIDEMPEDNDDWE